MTFIKVKMTHPPPRVMLSRGMVPKNQIRGVIGKIRGVEIDMTSRKSIEVDSALDVTVIK